MERKIFEDQPKQKHFAKYNNNNNNKQQTTTRETLCKNTTTKIKHTHPGHDMVRTVSNKDNANCSGIASGI
jgi:hypothetical protein